MNIHRLGSSALRHQSNEMLPGSARVVFVVNSSTSDGQASAYLARTGCLTMTTIIGFPLAGPQGGVGVVDRRGWPGRDPTASADPGRCEFQ